VEINSKLLSSSALIRIITAILLLISLANLNIGYYNFLRWVVTSSSIYMAIISFREKVEVGVWVFGLLALLFNPIFPFYLSKSLWRSVDVVAAIIHIVSIRFINKPSMSN